ncbi:MAG: hypothetical protein J6K14_05020 [Clostridia bacterium]|nr:hypothetical protein [Clostridia bacterium]
MKKILAVMLVLLMAFGLTGCALSELFNGNDNVVELGDGDRGVKWNLVANDNDCRPVESAYFEFFKSSFKYYENGALKKEGTHKITYFEEGNPNTPLHLNLNFGEDATGLSVYDYIDCYTEDKKDDLHQFTIVSEGYHIQPVRSGGVPVRDYHLSDMPYAFGTYVKEGAEPYEYKNGKVNYLECAKLNGRFLDENGNSFYFVNHSFSPNYQSTDYSEYTVYMRYENKANNTFLEGTVKLSRYEDWDTGEPHDVAVIHVMHGDSEPGPESGTSAEPDHQLADFTFGDDNSITFTGGDYFYENRECSYDPSNFIGGTYYKTNNN